MKTLQSRIEALEAIEEKRQAAALESSTAWIVANASDEELRAFQAWIFDPYYRGEEELTNGLDVESFGGLEALKNIMRELGAFDDERAKLLADLGARMPADLRRRGFMAWRYNGANEKQIAWLRAGN